MTFMFLVAADEFKPVGAQGGGGGEMSGMGLMIAAYALMWAALLAFLITVYRRAQQMEAKARSLEEAIAKAAKTAVKSGDA